MLLNRVHFALVILLASGLTLSSCIQKRKAVPPVARIDTTENTLHGVTWADDYYWLRERGKPEVLGYLEAENAYADRVMEYTANFQESLFQEMRARIKPR